MGDSKIFKCGFDIRDYRDILPDYTEYRKNDFTINAEAHTKGNIDHCIWQKYKPQEGETSSPQFREREVRRMLKTGVYAWISEEIVWIPPPLYTQLQYTHINGEPPEFRLKRLMNCYFRIRARNNPNCKGSFIVKNRQDGETTYSMCEAFWQTFDMEDGQITINSKTREDAQNPCWKTMQSIYMGIPSWVFETFFGDCITNGRNIAETIKFLRFADDSKNITAKNVQLAYYPTVYNSLDGKNSVRKAVGDEILKWLGCNFGDWFNNASKFIMPGFKRAGMFDLFSSPPEKDSQSYRDGYELWLNSDPKDRDETGTTKSRIERYHSNPLHGIEGAYDKFGDADPQRIYDHIMSERKRQPKSKLLEEIRGFPLNEEEIWGSMETSDFWDNQKGIEQRKIYLLGTRFKNEETKEPIAVYGNLEWKDGVKDSIVEFRQSEKEDFDLGDARFSFSFMPQNREVLHDIFTPPIYVENVIGIDSVDKRYPGKKHSNVAMVNYKFRDLYGTGIVKCPTMLYSNRPSPVEIAFEDAIKAMVFNRAMVQVESLNLNIVNWMEDRGYMKWVLSKRGETRDSLKKGDAPSGKSAFIDEIVGLINAITNIPLNPEDTYHLLNFWHKELLDDISVFNKKDTHANDISMGFGQALLGATKLLHEKKRKPSELNTGVLDYLLI